MKKERIFINEKTGDATILIVLLSDINIGISTINKSTGAKEGPVFIPNSRVDEFVELLNRVTEQE